MGLWPLQVIVLAFAVFAVAAALGEQHQLLRAFTMCGVVVALTLNPIVVERTRHWWHDGWSGQESDEVHLADHLARLIRARGADRAAIGYRVFEDNPPARPWHAVDDRWRYGAEFDVLLQYRNAIANLDRCGEGLSAADDYRVVVAQPPTSQYRYYFDVPTSRPLRFVTQFGPYQLFERD